MAEIAVTNYSVSTAAICRHHESGYEPRFKMLGVNSTAGVGTPKLYQNRYSGTNTIYLYITPLANSSSITARNFVETLQLIKSGFNISMVELARIFEVSRQTIYEWMDGNPPSDINMQKLNRLYVVLDILKEASIELSPQAIRRNINGMGSIIDAIRQDVDTAPLAMQLRQILQSEENQRNLLAKRLEGKDVTSIDISAYGASSYHEQG